MEKKLTPAVVKLRKRALKLSEKDMESLPLSELQGVAQILGQKGRGTREELTRRILRIQYIMK